MKTSTVISMFLMLSMAAAMALTHQLFQLRLDVSNRRVIEYMQHDETITDLYRIQHTLNDIRYDLGDDDAFMY